MAGGGHGACIQPRTHAQHHEQAVTAPSEACPTAPARTAVAVGEEAHALAVQVATGELAIVDVALGPRNHLRDRPVHRPSETPDGNAELGGGIDYSHRERAQWRTLLDLLRWPATLTTNHSPGTDTGPVGAALVDGSLELNAVRERKARHAKHPAPAGQPRSPKSARARARV